MRDGGRFALFFQGFAVTFAAVNRFSKAILIALGSLAALVVIAMVCVNLYLQSPGVQARIQAELSRVLRMPLTITSTSFTPWSDLRISGITIRDGETDLLNAASLRARYRFAPLLQRKLVIHKVTLDSPNIVWKQNAEGKWALAQQEKPAKPAPAEKKPRKETRDLEVIVESAQIKRGTIALLDKAELPVATFTDVTVDFTKLTPERIEGTAQIGRAAWENVLIIEETRTPFSYADGKLEFPALDARIGGGFVKGGVTFGAGDEATPFEGRLEFEHVDLARVSTESHWSESEMAGSLSGTLGLAGTVENWRRAEGNAKLSLRNGRFRNLFYFELIGQALQIKELSDLRLTDSQAELRFANEKAHIEAMTLDSANLQLSGTGLVRIDGKIQIAARLIARDRLFKQLPTFARDNFATAPDSSRFIEFNITGNTAKPKTDLLNKVVGQKIEAQFDDLLSSLFNTKKDDKKDEKKKDDKKKKKKEEPREEPAEARPEDPAESQ
jgi:type II secretion system protein N